MLPCWNLKPGTKENEKKKDDTLCSITLLDIRPGEKKEKKNDVTLLNTKPGEKKEEKKDVTLLNIKAWPGRKKKDVTLYSAASLPPCRLWLAMLHRCRSHKGWSIINHNDGHSFSKMECQWILPLYKLVHGCSMVANHWSNDRIVTIVFQKLHQPLVPKVLRWFLVQQPLNPIFFQ